MADLKIAAEKLWFLREQFHNLETASQRPGTNALIVMQVGITRTLLDGLCAALPPVAPFPTEEDASEAVTT